MRKYAENDRAQFPCIFSPVGWSFVDSLMPVTAGFLARHFFNLIRSRAWINRKHSSNAFTEWSQWIWFGLVSLTVCWCACVFRDGKPFIREKRKNPEKTSERKKGRRLRKQKRETRKSYQNISLRFVPAATGTINYFYYPQHTNTPHITADIMSMQFNLLCCL